MTGFIGEIVLALLTLGAFGTTCYLYVSGTSVPPGLEGTTGLLIGSYVRKVKR